MKGIKSVSRPPSLFTSYTPLERLSAAARGLLRTALGRHALVRALGLVSRAVGLVCGMPACMSELSELSESVALLYT